MQHYYETRNLPTNPPATIAADLARHIQMRQYLGTILIICDSPTAILSATRKQWFKAVRSLQRLRASTLNAEEILRLTHALMHMQNMQFTSNAHTDQPDATAYFAAPGRLNTVPPNCYSVYLTTGVTKPSLDYILKSLPKDCLVVSYAQSVDLTSFGLQPKTALEEKLLRLWDDIVAFLQQNGIDPAKLIVGNALQLDAMDAALDTLLGISDDFLHTAARLQRTINLAQPFTFITSNQQKKFEAVTRLAHRVQALTPGTFNGYLSTSFGDNQPGTLFLRDAGSELYADLEAAATRTTAPPMS
jgi:hypothetical protein